MDVHEFTREVQHLLRAEVEGVAAGERLAIVRQQLALAEEAGALLDHRLTFVPFVPGRRPIDEVRSPGLGSSEAIGVLGGAAPDHVTLLYRITHAGQGVAPPKGTRLRATLSRLGDDGREAEVVPGWDGREVAPIRIGALEPDVAPRAPDADQAFALRLDVESIFGPLRGAPDPGAPFGFGSCFVERFRLDLALERGGATIAADGFELDVFDEAAFGSLYHRVSSRLLPEDLRRQLAEAGRDDVGVAFHPWFPVLCIGVEKAHLYMRAVRGDVVRERRMLTDPAWLLRVGLYLELLTCLGIAEAARTTVELLTPAERALYERSPRWAEVRARVDVEAWSAVWAQRGIAFLRTPGLDLPVGFQNLLRKKAATLAFLHAHHADLKHAIALAGENRTNAQETWQRVFRDAERATLRMSEEAFPELGYLPKPVRRFILWHRQGSAFGIALSATLSGLFGDQDGLYLSACVQYRASMNDIAAWAAARGLMEYTGAECVPASVSLLESHLAGNHVRLAQLQRRDGYAGTLELQASDEEPRLLPPDEVRARIAGIALFRVLTGDELDHLARLARTITLGPTERILVQGNPGSSLFVLHDGALEVIVKTDGREHTLAELQPGAVVGEVAFLTGQPRTATVRAVDAATVIEIAARHLEPIVRERPAILDELGALMARRRELADEALTPAGVLARIAAAIFGD